MSNTAEEQAFSTIETSDDGNQEISDLEARKLNDTTFDTEDESDDQNDDAAEGNGNENDNDDEGLELDARDAAVDILDQLVELFIERNGREPNEEEVLQWIDVFKSLKIEDVDEEAEKGATQEEEPAADATAE